MSQLDPTEQRIVGVLIEKQLSVPDSYPLTENTLLAGCNQSSNRDPIGDYAAFQIAGALMALHEKGWVARVEGAGRVPKFRHRADERLGRDVKFLAVMAELLLRGPQASGALKPRVARMGYHAEPAAIESCLQELAQHRPALVEQLPLGPRERDRRWRHLLGARSEPARTERAEALSAPQSAPAAARPSTGLAAPTASLESRVAELERQVTELRRQFDELRS